MENVQVEFGGQKHKKRSGHVFWGIVLLMGAAAIVVGRLGYFDEIGVWNIVLSAALICLAGNGIARHSFGEILFSLAFLIIVNDKLLRLEAITPWPVLGAALLGTIGLNVLFPGFHKKRSIMKLHFNGSDKTHDGSGPVFEEKWDGASVSYDNAFGGVVKYLTDEISHVSVDNAFGSMQVYFTDAKLLEERAAVDVDTSFGNVILYVPASWKVVISTDNAFGAVREEGHCNPNGSTVLYVRGDVSFGCLQIRYV